MPQVRAARDTGGRNGPGDPSASRRTGICSSISAKSATSPASRARCLIGLLRTAPGGQTFQARTLSSGDRRLPTAIGAPAHLNGRHRLYGVRPTGPRVTRSRRAGTVQLQPPDFGCAYCTRARPPPPIRATRTPPEAPLVDRGARIVREDLRPGISYFLRGCGDVARMERSEIRDLPEQSETRAMCVTPTPNFADAQSGLQAAAQIALGVSHSAARRASCAKMASQSAKTSVATGRPMTSLRPSAREARSPIDAERPPASITMSAGPVSITRYSRLIT